MALNTRIERRRLKDLVPQAVNARYMSKLEFDRLVANVKSDGILTSVPLVYQPGGQGPTEILSGHHRIKAAIAALGNDTEQDVMVVLDAQSRDELIGRQLSHNSINGMDDPATLKALYEEIESVDWKQYAGLDDQELKLIEAVDAVGLPMVNLDFQTVTILFIPSEVDRAEAAMVEATKVVKPDTIWVTAMKDYDKALAALDSTRQSYTIGNVAVAFSVILDVFEAHLTDLAHGWQPNPDQSKRAPFESIFGVRSIPQDAAAVVEEAVDKAIAAGDATKANPWLILERWAADYLAGP